MLSGNGINKNIKLTWLVSISIQTAITYNIQVMEVLLMHDLSVLLGHIANSVYFSIVLLPFMANSHFHLHNDHLIFSQS